MFAFAHVWPWIGLGAAGVLVLLLFATDSLRSDPGVSRWRDVAWLTWLATCAYLLHQFEEHGIDAQGAAYAFYGKLCTTMGLPQAGACPLPTAFITSVNVSAVWLAGPLSALLGRRWPALALSFFSVPFVNIFAHAGPAIVQGSYNPGLVTAIVLFAPLSLWTFSVALTRPGLGWRAVMATIVAGILLHAILLGSLKAYLNGSIGVDLLVVIQIVNALLPMPVMLLLGGHALRHGRGHAHRHV
jgi:Protein of unknown function with HXXEE motif